MNFLCKILRVNENEGLCRLACLEDIFDKIQFLSFLALHVILLNVIQLKFLRLNHNLLCFSNDFLLSLLEKLESLLFLGLKCCGEQDPLHCH